MLKRLVSFGMAMTLLGSGTAIAAADNTKYAAQSSAHYYAAVETLEAQGLSTVSTLDKDSLLDEVMLGALTAEDSDRLNMPELTDLALQQEVLQAQFENLLNEYDGVLISCKDALNIRTAPVDGRVIRTIRAGKVAHLLAVEDGWYQISYGKTIGYVSPDYCQTVHYQDYEGTSATSTVREDVVAAAMEWLGTRYVYGGSSRKGTDCSGFTMAVFREFGYSLAHGASDQKYASTAVSSAERDVGDLVFFSFYGDGRIAHVGIYIGGGQFIHASTSRGVIISSLSESYYARNYLGAGRILTD